MKKINRYVRESMDTLFKERDQPNLRNVRFLMKLMIMACIYFTLQITSIFAEKHYQLVNLGLLNNRTSLASSINNYGQVCGIYNTEWGEFIFIWDPVKGLNYTKVKSSAPPIINNQGSIFGSYYCLLDSKSGDYIQEYIFKWQNPLDYLTLFNFKTLYYPTTQKSNAYAAKRSIVWDVNDSNQILVSNQPQNYIQETFIPFNKETEYQAWIYYNYDFFKIEDPRFIAFKINNYSEVLGVFSTTTDNIFNKKKFTTSIYNLKTNTFHNLNLPAESLGTDINDEGQVVGVFYDPSNDSIRGFFNDSFNNLIYIDNFIPKSVNNNGQIIGEFMNGERKNKPAIWDNGYLFDLLDLTSLIDDRGYNWDSLNALLDINDKGQIVGYGNYQGAIHGFLLVPVAVD